MKQVTIFCSTDLEDLVVSTLDRVGVRSFSALKGASGNLFAPPGEVPRITSFDAMVIVVPATEDGKARALAQQLDAQTGSGQSQTCLRVVVSAVERVVGHD